MEFVDVYRVEKRGVGPFRDDISSGCMCSNHPTPQYDAGLPDLSDTEIHPYRFGCPSPDSMKEWITKPIELTNRGYKVSLYRAKKKYVHSSEIQSMFIKRHAKKVGEWSVVDFCNQEIFWKPTSKHINILAKNISTTPMNSLVIY